MADDIEARLRAALHAYADVVDDPGTDLPRPAPIGATRRTAVQRWRGPAMVAAAVVAVTGGAWWAVGDSPGQDVVAGSSVAGSSVAARPSPSPESAAGGSAGGTTNDSAAQADAGMAASPQVGVPFPLDLLTHCGVFGADVGGRWFALDRPLVQGAGNPPAGWDNPYQSGTLTLTSADAAVFTDDAGHRVVLHAAPESARPAPCE